ncbi:calmodulin [Streptomyces sp. NPDC060322]|uniref:BP74-related protein n=1 Tax=Streptomyces sp. NPDC060322 TaxID=3347097 RepID=UPI00364E8127
MATARFAFQAPPGRGEEFIFELTNDALIAHAREVLSGDELSKTHVGGRIVKKKAPYNPAFSYHLDPATISFFEVNSNTREDCDASPHYLEDHLDEAGGAFLPGGYWGSWDSKLTREVKA